MDFLNDSLNDVRRVHPEFTTDEINYIVHFNTWPFEDEGPQLSPPPGCAAARPAGCGSPLTPAETSAKRQALRRFTTQMHVMDWFLDGVCPLQRGLLAAEAVQR